MSLTIASGQRLEGTAAVDGETIAIRSDTEDGVRATRLVGPDGAVHADWRVSAIDLEITGSYAGRSFGRPEDSETDMDPLVWQPILHARTGEVLDGVAALAAAHHLDPEFALAADALDDLASMSAHLADMAGEPADVPDGIAYSACTPRWNDSLSGHSAYVGGSMMIVWTAVTSPQSPVCKHKQYCARLFNKNGTAFSTAECVTGGTADAFRRVVGGLGKTYCKRGKHWGGKRAATWTSRCVNT